MGNEGELMLLLFGNDILLHYFPSFQDGEGKVGRSQWPRGLGHELSSPARTLGSRVHIPLEAWILVCVYSVFVL
jgi:hypothetical protein